MANPKVALVVVSSPYEAGGERAEPALRLAAEKLRDAGLDVAAAPSVVWNPADAADAARAWAGTSADLLVIIQCSWVEDSLQFQLQRELDAPVFLWTLPYPETYALASVKHLASIATRTGLVVRWGQGEVDDPRFAQRVADFARTAAVAKRLRRSHVALLTPRTAWRMFGPMDMSYDEWDLGSRLGVTLLHLDLEELIATAEEESETEARAELERHAPAYGRILAADERMLFSAKVYLAARRIIERYDLLALAAACYPTHFGLVNIASSWLSDEGYHFDPEGDVGSAVVANAMLALKSAPVSLVEPVLLREDTDSVFLRHEGSAPASLAASPSEVHVIDLADQRGTLIEFPLKAMERVTSASLSGRDGRYTLHVGSLRSREIPLTEWERWGRGFLADVTAAEGGARLLDRMFESGMDHHMLLQEGDLKPQLRDLAELWGIEFKSITD